MKQGSYSTIADGAKREPHAKAVNVKHVADIGQRQLLTKPRPMYEGRGLEAPKATMTTHHCGSQGKH